MELKIIDALKKHGNSRGVTFDAKQRKNLGLEDDKIYEFTINVKELGKLTQEELKIKQLESELKNARLRLKESPPVEGRTLFMYPNSSNNYLLTS